MFRILSLDGGGIKGAFTASVLAAIENEINEPIGELLLRSGLPR
jgi:patatin-like phospholipase/acyl hydrolase